MAIEQHAHSVGKATVTCIRELALVELLTPTALFPDWDASLVADHPDWLPPEAMDESREHIVLSVHSWLVQDSGRTISRRVDQLPDAKVLDEIKQKVSITKLEETLMREGVKKFADPMKALLALIADKRRATAGQR